jgi:hypothetical protein
MALNDALNKSTLTLHSSKKIGRLLMPNGNASGYGTTNNTPQTSGATTSPNVIQQ